MHALTKQRSTFTALKRSVQDKISVLSRCTSGQLVTVTTSDLHISEVYVCRRGHCLENNNMYRKMHLIDQTSQCSGYQSCVLFRRSRIRISARKLALLTELFEIFLSRSKYINTDRYCFLSHISRFIALKFLPFDAV
jgi:hypothetical protein